MALRALVPPGIRVRLGAAFAVLIVLSLANAGLALRHAEAVNERLEDVYARQLLGMKAIDERWLELHRADRMLRAGSEEGRTRMRQHASALSVWAGHRSTAGTGGAAEHKLARRLRESAARLAQAADGATLPAEAFDEVEELLSQLSDVVKYNAETHYEYAKAEHAKARAVGLMGAWAMAIAGVMLAIWIVRAVSTRLDEALGIARRVAQGDLSVDRPAERPDEIGRLVTSMGTMVARLIDMLGRVREGTGAIRRATEEVARGGRELAGRGERQVRRAADFAGVAGELAASARTNHERATRAAESASAADACALAGAQSTAVLRDCIHHLQLGAGRIADIVGVIGRVASKTNLIALNAAVEAAHAGNQGRGFAVVAAEVRSLAQEARQEAARINGIVSEDLRLIAQARAHVDSLHQAIERVRESAATLASGMQEIIVASAAQTEAVQRMSAVADEARDDVALDVQLAERSVSTVAELSEQASRLADLLEEFTLPHSARGPIVLLPVSVTT